jgi:cytochrome c oxidase assembly protein subunit 15
MSTNPTTSPASVSSQHYRILKITSALVYLLIVLGGIVCITDASRACPDWPGCYGKLIPPLETGAIIEYTHRLVAMITGFFLIATLVMGWKRTPNIKPLKWLPVLALLLTGAVSVFGAIAVLSGLSPIAAAFDLGFALLVLAVTLTTTLLAFAHRESPEAPVDLSLANPLARFSLVTTLLVFTVLDSAVLVAEGGSVVRCVGWPMYFGQLAPENLNTLPQIIRLCIAALASLFIIYLFFQIRKTQTQSSPIRRASNAVGLFFFAEIVLGGMMIVLGYSIPLLVFYVAAAVALWGSMVVLTALLGTAKSS